MACDRRIILEIQQSLQETGEAEYRGETILPAGYARKRAGEYRDLAKKEIRRE